MKNQIIIEAEKRYEYIIIDCAPTYSILTTLALNATEAVLIPVKADSFAIYGQKLMTQIIKEHEEDYGINIKVIGLVFLMWDPKEPAPAYQTHFHQKIVNEWGLSTFRTKISKNEWYTISNYKGGGIWNSGSHLNIKKEFKDYVTEFVEKVSENGK